MHTPMESWGNARARRWGALGLLFIGVVMVFAACDAQTAGGNGATANGGDGATSAAGEAMGADAMDEGTMDHDAMDHSGHDHGGGEAPAGAAVLFAEHVFGVNGGDYGISFGADGRSIYFTRAMPLAGKEAIYVTRLVAGQWTAAEVAPFSGRFHDKEPYVSPDGARLYFASRRPVSGSREQQDFDIWYADRSGDGWSEPVPLDAVNTEHDDDYPAVAADGTLVFARNDDAGNNDLWIAPATESGLSEPQPFARPINSVYAEADPWIAPDGATIVFSSSRITDGAQGQGDLYVIHRRGDSWTDPSSLGSDVNTIAHEYGPALSPDGMSFYFSRGFGGQVWVLPRAALHDFEGTSQP